MLLSPFCLFNHDGNLDPRIVLSRVQYGAILKKRRARVKTEAGRPDFNRPRRGYDFSYPAAVGGVFVRDPPVVPGDMLDLGDAIHVLVWKIEENGERKYY